MIEPNEDFENECMKCLGCSAVFDLRAISLFQCAATVKYMKINDTETTTKQISVTGDDYFKFGMGIWQGVDEKNQPQPIASRVVGSSQNASNRNVQRPRLRNDHQYPILKFDVKNHE